MSTARPTRGDTIKLDYGSEVQLEGIIVADPDFQVGEAEPTTIQALDGTKYSTTGETGDNTASLEVLQTIEEIEEIMTYAYGTPTTVGNKKTWDLSSPSDTSGTLTIESPVLAGTQDVWTLVGAKSLSVSPLSPLGDFKRVNINIVGDNWEFSQETGL